MIISTFFMGEKSSTMLHNAAAAVDCTSTDSSDSSLNSGTVTPASTKLVRSVFTDLLKLRVHMHAAALACIPPLQLLAGPVVGGRGWRDRGAGPAP